MGNNDGKDRPFTCVLCCLAIGLAVYFGNKGTGEIVIVIENDMPNVSVEAFECQEKESGSVISNEDHDGLAKSEVFVTIKNNQGDEEEGNGADTENEEEMNETEEGNGTDTENEDEMNETEEGNDVDAENEDEMNETEEGNGADTENKDEMNETEEGNGTESEADEKDADLDDESVKEVENSEETFDEFLEWMETEL